MGGIGKTMKRKGMVGTAVKETENSDTAAVNNVRHWISGTVGACDHDRTTSMRLMPRGCGGILDKFLLQFPGSFLDCCDTSVCI